jgi:hypothetical protein
MWLSDVSGPTALVRPMHRFTSVVSHALHTAPGVTS